MMAFHRPMLATIAMGLLGWLSLASTRAAAAGDPISFTLLPVYLNSEDIKQHDVGDLHFVAGYKLRTSDYRFGGVSGLVIEADGVHFLAITDTARWLTGQLHLDADGQVVGLDDTFYGTLHERDGRPLAPNGSGSVRDSEAVTKTLDGAYLVSFERQHRILRFAGSGAGIDGVPTLVPTPKRLNDAPANGGLEAMTSLPDGRLLLITEELLDDNGDHVGWVVGPDGPHELSAAATGIFKPTDLASLPNGDVLLLERRFTPIGGLAGRISLITADQIAGGKRLQGRELALLQPPLTVDNYEALAVTPAPGGGWNLYVMSDNNFNSLQNTLLMQFRWDGR